MAHGINCTGYWKNGSRCQYKASIICNACECWLCFRHAESFFDPSPHLSGNWRSTWYCQKCIIPRIILSKINA